MGIWSLFMKPGRIEKSAATLSPVTLFKFHEALKKTQVSPSVLRAQDG